MMNFTPTRWIAGGAGGGIALGLAIWLVSGGLVWIREVTGSWAIPVIVNFAFWGAAWGCVMAAVFHKRSAP